MKTLPSSVSISLNEPLTQKNLNEIERFKNSLKSNERVRIGFGGSGNEIVFSRHQESKREKGLRQIGNLFNKIKQSTAVNRNLILLNAKVNNAKNSIPELFNINSHVQNKFHASSAATLSKDSFQSFINPLANKLAVPVLDTLQNPNIRNVLNNLNFKNKTNPMNSQEVSYIAGPGEKLSNVVDEYRAFINLAKDQANGEGKTYHNQKAVDFAKRWQGFQKDWPEEMKFIFGDKEFNAISDVAAKLLAFINDSQA